jgi:hypothetical protein
MLGPRMWAELAETVGGVRAVERDALTGLFGAVGARFTSISV